MRKWLRRIRGALGTGLTWGAVWGVCGSLVELAMTGGVGGAAIFAAMGFLSGSGFAVILSLVDGRRTIGEMSLGRFAAWGGLGGLMLSTVLVLTGGTPLLPALAYSGAVILLAAASAASSLALARLGSAEELGPASQETAGFLTDSS